MKRKSIISILLATSLTASAYAQSAQGGASVNANATANPAQVNVDANTPANTGTGSLPPGLEKQNPLPPGLQREELPPGLAKRTNTVGQTGSGFTSSNQFGMNSNQFRGASNGFAFNTNQFNSNSNLTPTSDRTNSLNSTFNSTNQFGNLRNVTTHDQATTATDRSLLIQIQQTITTQLSITAANGALPVHFWVDNGVVRVFGTLPTLTERQRLVSLVQQTPGVVRVLDETQIGGQPTATTGVNTTMETPGGTVNAAGNVNGQTSITTTNSATPSQAYSGSGAYYYDSNPANFSLPPTSRSNSYNLPPGLQRDELPPGLQRDTLPPGLEKRTNPIVNP